MRRENQKEDRKPLGPCPQIIHKVRQTCKALAGGGFYGKCCRT